MFIHELFLSAARRSPLHTALSFGEAALSYGECADRVEQLAQELAAQLPQRARVAINTYKSIDTILLMLACLRAGLTYVPIDPSGPIERRRFIVRDSMAVALVVDERTSADWATDGFLETARPLANSLKPLQIALASSNLPGRAGHRTRTAPAMTRSIDHDDLAYILYTSGSTGDPKGVMITHGNARAFVDWGVAYFDIGPDDRVALHAPLHFDLPVFDLYVGLAQGATVYPIDEKTALFPEALLRFLGEKQITVLYAVPSALTALISRSTLAEKGLPTLRLLLYAGEEFHPTPLARLMAALPFARIFNLYGPIETNVVTVFEVHSEHLSAPRIPIGHPIFHTTIFLINADGQPIEMPGQEGEIVVSGPSVSPGYLNQAERTARSRLILEYRSRQWECYRTGDFARFDEAGVLHFLGRRDALIKTRGFRVDLGDVEANLTNHPAIDEAAVVARPHTEYTNLLYAFIVPRRGAQLEERSCLAWCREHLPSYMVPYRVMLCDQLPKTSTNKIARRQLEHFIP